MIETEISPLIKPLRNPESWILAQLRIISLELLTKPVINAWPTTNRIIFSAIGLSKIKNQADIYKGKGLAIAGLIIGIADILFLIGYLMIFYFNIWFILRLSSIKNK